MFKKKGTYINDKYWNTGIPSFKDLVFETNERHGMQQCFIDFHNNYGLSIVPDEFPHSRESTYEVAILYNGSFSEGSFQPQVYDITGGEVLSGQTTKDVDSLLSTVWFFDVDQEIKDGLLM